MANRYWVGGSGNWGGTTHWATSSGGASGASEPTVSDAVIFDANSFSGSCIVTVDSTAGASTGTALSAGFDSSTVTGLLTMNLGSGGVQMQCRGNMNIKTTKINMTCVFLNLSTGTYTLTTDVTDATVDYAAAPSYISTAATSGTGTTLSLSSKFAGGVSVVQGTFTTNNNGVTAASFGTSSGVTVNLGSSAVRTRSISINSGTTMNAGTSTIDLTPISGTTNTFAGGGKTYSTVNINSVGAGTLTTAAVTGANTFANLTVQAGQFTTLTMPASATTTITTALSIPDGTSGSHFTLNSSTSGTAATLSKSSGTITVNYVDIKDSTATGGATWSDINGTSVSGNTGWIFGRTFTQTAKAYIVVQPTKTQTAKARIAMRVTKSQTAVSRVANVRTATQVATAHIVDSTRITKRHLYKMYDGNTFLGLLPKVTSTFQFNQDINTLGAQIKVDIGVSADVAGLPSVATIETEAGAALETEAGNSITTEGATPIVGVGVSTQTLIKNGNRLEVWEYSNYHPNGKRMFGGSVERWEAAFGINQDGISVIANSDGQDMNNYLVQGSPYVSDVSQTTDNATTTITNNVGGSGVINQVAQTWKIGAGVTNLGAIDLKLNGTADVTLKVYAAGVVPSTPTSDTPIGSTTQHVSTTGTQVVQVAFPSPVTVTAASTYFVAASVGNGQSITISYQNTNPYADGAMYVASGGPSTPSWNVTPIGGIATASDLYFKTYKNAGATTAVFTSQDPVTGIGASVMDRYKLQGGRVTYDLTTISATGLSVPYTFNTQTVAQGMQTIKNLSPYDFYYYVDIGDSILNFKERSSTADFVVTKGVHVQSLNIVASIENLKNSFYFSGGDDGSGFNLYRHYSDATSIGYYGPRVGIQSDGRVTLTTTADAIGQSFVQENKDEQFQTVLTIVDDSMDITLIKPGLTIGFNGFGNFVDSLILQVVRLSYTPSLMTLTLGILPPKVNPKLEQAVKDLQTLQTVANPASPS